MKSENAMDTLAPPALLPEIRTAAHIKTATTWEGPVTEQALDIKTADGVADSHVFYPDGPGAWPAVIFFMDGLGIRPEMHVMGRRLAAAGYYVVQPNLYYRAGRSPLLDAAKVFTDEAERAKLFGLIRQLTPDVVVRDAGAWLQFLSQQPQVKGSKVGAVGYCMGGAMVLRAAAHYPDRIVGRRVLSRRQAGGRFTGQSAPSCAKNPSQAAYRSGRDRRLDDPGDGGPSDGRFG